MKTKTLFRLCGVVQLAVGLPTLYVAEWGVLWRYYDVTHFNSYVLRPGMWAIGTVATLIGLWHLWMRWTTFGRVLVSWAEACKWERDMDKLWGAQLPPDEFQPRTLAADLHYLWYLVTHCGIGRHDPNAFSYSNGGEDGPRGTVCCDCGLYISRRNLQLPHVPVPEDVMRAIEAMYDEPRTIMVLYPDGNRYPEDAPTKH